MQIKRFEAKNMTEALRQIKRELGAEAVILSATDIRKENRLLGISRKIGVEVTAAVDGGLSGHKRPGPSASNERRPAVLGPAAMARTGHLDDEVRDTVKLGGAKYPGKPAGTIRTAGGAVRPAPAPSLPKTRSKDNLVGSGTRGASENNPTENDRSDWSRHMHKRLKAGGLEIFPWPFTGDGSHLIALVGSAGVGKTTTIAKLAARLQHEQGRQVGLISLDREKIGGVEQLRIYAEILKIPLETPRTGKDFQKALKALSACDVVLVDTPAIGASRVKRPAVFEDLLGHMAALQVWLVIGADNQVANMQAAATIGADLDPKAVIITKIDMNHKLDGVMQFLSAAALPVVCLANGPDVPADLEDASFDRFAHLLVQSGDRDEHVAASETSGPDPQSDGQYLANRNSDIFHRPGCKWIRLINKENIVMFTSFAEALNNRFKPCRYCNPQHMSITGILSQERAVR